MRSLLTMLLAVLVTTTAVYAQDFRVNFGTASQDRSAPVEISADSLQIDQATGHAQLRGNVFVSQGDLQFTAPEVDVVYSTDESRVSKMYGKGGVSIVSGQDTAKAQNAEYDLDTGLIHMDGNVSLLQGINTITAQRMTVDLDSSKAELHGRVKTVLRPKGN